MPYDIIIGRTEEDRKKYGKDGTILIGKQYVRMGQTTSLSNEIYLDVTRSHVVFVCGKRGSGKSYSMGVITEGIANVPLEVRENISVVMLDTMGIYWTMKYANKQDEELLSQWGLKATGLNVHVYTPFGYYQQMKESGIPTDFPFSIKPTELTPADWCLTFSIGMHEQLGVFIESMINKVKKEKREYDIDDIIRAIEADEEFDQATRTGARNRFEAAKLWGLFSKDGTPITELVKGGQVTILDVGCYAMIPGASGLRALVIGLVSQRLFVDRMIARKVEELKSIKSEMHYLMDEEKSERSKEEPLVWLVVDEAHEFLPNEGKTAASDALITILREGRQPGISLILATQQPGKIHTDVMTQSDIVLAHSVTAKLDTEALGALMQSYMREGLDKQLNYLPKTKGAAIIFDDTNERMYPLRIRPRITWHGGSSPSAIKEKKRIFEF